MPHLVSSISVCLPESVEDDAPRAMAQVDATSAMAAWIALMHRHLQQDDMSVLLHTGPGAPRQFRFQVRADMAVASLLEQTRQTLVSTPLEPAPNLDANDADVNACFVHAANRLTEPEMASYLAHGMTTQLLVVQYPGSCEAFLQFAATNPEVTTQAQALASQLQRLWEGMGVDPQCALMNLPLLGQQEKDTLLSLGRGPSEALDTKPLYQLVEAQAAITPHATAVSFLDTQLSYGELNRCANRLARELRQHGVESGKPVASFLEPCLEVAIALLAIHKAGGIYVPLDPTHPADRIAVLMDDVQPVAVLTKSHLCERLPGQSGATICLDQTTLPNQAPDNEHESGNLNLVCNPSQTAYIVYTSGTTGKPKGVMASHANLSHYVQVARAAYRMGPGDRMPAMARFTFSITMFELWTPLVSGAELRLIPRAHVLDFNRLVELFGSVTFVHCAPALMRNLLNHMEAQGVDGSLFTALRHVSCGGDFVAFELLERMKKAFPQAEVFVIYGCTEIACMGCTFQAPHDRALTRNTVGRVMSNVTLRLLDAQLQPVPLGVKGEVCFSGPGINQGYWRLPQLTAERFIELDGMRIYRTGDWGRLDANGQLELLGRTDFQMKVRGMRMEPLEIESTLRQAPGVRDALVAARQLEGATEKTLVAYLAFNSGDNPEVGAVRDFLKQRLPEYMIPSLFVAMAALPVNLNGKLDRSALPMPHAGLLMRQSPDEAPHTATEQALANIWSNVLSISPIQRDSDFFELGGDSLSSVLLLMEVQRRLGLKLAVDAPLRAPTLREMATLIDTGAASSHTGLVLLRSGRDTPPVFCVYGALLYRELSQHLQPGRSVYGAYLAEEVSWLSAQSSDKARALSIPEMAVQYMAMLRSVQPQGPYVLVGESFGGLIALEMAQQLKASGDSASLVVMLDCHAPNTNYMSTRPLPVRIKLHLQLLRERGLTYVAERMERRRKLMWEGVASQLPAVLRALRLTMPRKILEAAGDLTQRRATHKASDAYQPTAYDGKVLLFRAEERNLFEWDEGQDLGWGRWLTQLSIEQVPGNHLSILRSPNVEVLAARLNRYLSH